MTERLVRSGFLLTPILAVLLGATALAQSAREAIRPGARAPATSARPATKAVLPDPALLDGSKQPAEKRPEQGMLGAFEIPGDENVREGQVGGQQQQQQQGNQQQQQQGQGGGGQVAQAEAQQQDQAGGGGGAEQGEQGQQQGAQAGGGGQQGDPGAMAGGIQVAQLQGEGDGNSGEMPVGQKPPQVSIGDSAMQIKSAPNSPQVVGATQTSGQTQQHEKTTGTGGKQPTGNNANRGAERGRTMPAGL